jgi:hypothetical protein
MIEHPITDYPTWKAAFDRFAAARQQAGVRRHAIQQPIDDPAYVLVALDFDSVPEAERFVGFLRANVWASPATAPGLAGPPQTRIVQVMENG